MATYNTDLGAFAHWHTWVQAANLSSWLAAKYNATPAPHANPPPVLLLPSNIAMAAWAARHNMTAAAPTKWTSQQLYLFKNATAHLVMPWAVAKRRWPRYFVRSQCVVLGITQSVDNPLEGMGLELWGGKGPGLEGTRRARYYRGGGRRLRQSSATYGVLAQGYNTLAGFPLYYTGVDPGYTFNQIFDTASFPVTDTSSSTVCSSVFETVPYYTAFQMQAGVAKSIGVPSEYSAAAFSSNSWFKQFVQLQEIDQDCLFPTYNTAQVAGYSVNVAAVSSSWLDANYLTALTTLANAADNATALGSLIPTFAASYGLSYVQEVGFGAAASTVSLLASEGYGNLQLESCDLGQQANTVITSQANASYVCEGACPNLSGCLEQLNTYTTSVLDAVQVPADVPIPFTTSDGVDCPAYASAATAAVQDGTLAPVSTALGDQYSLFSEPWLFPAAIQASLPTVASALLAYFTACPSDTACPPNNYCPLLSFAADGTCVLCYDDTSASSPLCIPDDISSCTASSCACTGGFYGSTCSQCNANCSYKRTCTGCSGAGNDPATWNCASCSTTNTCYGCSCFCDIECNNSSCSDFTSSCSCEECTCLAHDPS